MVKRYAVLLLASMLSAVATAAGTGQHGVTLRLGGYYTYRVDEDLSKDFVVTFLPAVLPQHYRDRDSRYEHFYPLIPSFVLGVGYRFAQCPVEVSAELVQEGLFRFFPQLYHPIAHLFGYTYGGVSVSWWF